MVTKVPLIFLLIFMLTLNACGMFNYEVENLDSPSQSDMTYLYSNTNAGWTTSFNNGEQLLPDGNVIRVETVLAPVQKQSVEIKDGYSFSVSIEGVVIQ